MQKPLLSLVGMFLNEARSVRRVLESVKPFCDRWTIVDTGSTDGTQEIIREVMAGIPGTLHVEDFAGYMVTRNRVIDLDAAADEPARFQLMMSGDEALVNGAELRKYLEEDGDKADAHYLQVIINGRTDVPRPVVTRTGSDFRYDDEDCGVHEIAVNLVNPQAPVWACRTAYIEHDTLDMASHERRLDTVRQVHIPLLVAAIERNPANCRAVEYLAQSYAYLANYEADDDERDEFLRESCHWFFLRMAMPFKSDGERNAMSVRFIDTARASGKVSPARLLDVTNRLCQADKVHAEPALLRTMIAATVEGIGVMDVYNFAKDAIERAQVARTDGIKDTGSRSVACEWQAHRFAAIAAMNLAKVNPERAEVAREHITAGIRAGGPWAAFQPIQAELEAPQANAP